MCDPHLKDLKEGCGAEGAGYTVFLVEEVALGDDQFADVVRNHCLCPLDFNALANLRLGFSRSQATVVRGTNSSFLIESVNGFSSMDGRLTYHRQVMSDHDQVLREQHPPPYSSSVLNLRTTTPQKCAAVPRRARI